MENMFNKEKISYFFQIILLFILLVVILYFPYGLRKIADKFPSLCEPIIMVDYIKKELSINSAEFTNICNTRVIEDSEKTIIKELSHDLKMCEIAVDIFYYSVTLLIYCFIYSIILKIFDNIYYYIFQKSLFDLLPNVLAILITIVLTSSNIWFDQSSMYAFLFCLLKKYATVDFWQQIKIKMKK